MNQPTDYTTQLYVQAAQALPGIVAAAADIAPTVADTGCYDLVSGPLAEALAKAGADCCVADQLGLTAMMLAELARRYADLRDRVEQLGLAPDGAVSAPDSGQAVFHCPGRAADGPGSKPVCGAPDWNHDEHDYPTADAGRPHSVTYFSESEGR